MPSKLAGASRGRDYALSSVEKAIEVLGTFTDHEPELSVTEIARRMKLPKARVHRYLVSLAHTGLVEQNPATGHYGLGLRSLELARLVLRRLDAVAIAEPHLHELALWTELTATLHVWDGRAAVAVRIVWGRGPVNIGVQVGARLALHATAAGKVFLALGPPRHDLAVLGDQLTAYTKDTCTSLPQLVDELRTVRIRGWAMSDGELIPGITAVAFPVFGHTGEMAASLSLVGTSPAVHDRLNEHLAVVRRTAITISRALGYTGIYADRETATLGTVD